LDRIYTTKPTTQICIAFGHLPTITMQLFVVISTLSLQIIAMTSLQTILPTIANLLF